MPSHPVFLKSCKKSISLLEEPRGAPMAEGGGRGNRFPHTSGRRLGALGLAVVALLMAATGHAQTRASAPTNIPVNFATGLVDYN